MELRRPGLQMYVRVVQPMSTVCPRAPTVNLPVMPEPGLVTAPHSSTLHPSAKLLVLLPPLLPIEAVVVPGSRSGEGIGWAHLAHGGGRGTGKRQRGERARYQESEWSHRTSSRGLAGDRTGFDIEARIGNRSGGRREEGGVKRGAQPGSGEEALEGARAAHVP